jgi:hypothetical protein
VPRPKSALGQIVLQNSAGLDCRGFYEF